IINKKYDINIIVKDENYIKELLNQSIVPYLNTLKYIDDFLSKDLIYLKYINMNDFMYMYQMHNKKEKVMEILLFKQIEMIEKEWDILADTLKKKYILHIRDYFYINKDNILKIKNI